MEISDVLQPGVRGVVFDLDGTLYSKQGLAFRLMGRECAHLCLLLAERRARRALAGQYFGSDFRRVFFGRMAQHAPFGLERARAWYWEHYMPAQVSLLRAHYEARAWVLPLLEECRRRGVCTVVCSDYDMPSEKIEALGLNPALFDHIASSADLGGLKPSTASAEQLLGLMHLSGSEVVVVGDRDDTDGQLARCIGARFVLVTD